MSCWWLFCVLNWPHLHFCPLSPDYNVEFFRKFVLVMNALDNRGIPMWPYHSNIYCYFLTSKHIQMARALAVSTAARNHVNRMCLAADIPLIESGTAGYLGQVTVIKKVDLFSPVTLLVIISFVCRSCPVNVCLCCPFMNYQGLTECYECQPKPTQKTFPGCTIRNTPSEPIHCIVWAKYLFKWVCHFNSLKTPFMMSIGWLFLFTLLPNWLGPFQRMCEDNQLKLQCTVYVYKYRKAVGRYWMICRWDKVKYRQTPGLEKSHAFTVMQPYWPGEGVTCPGVISIL